MENKGSNGNKWINKVKKSKGAAVARWIVIGIGIIFLLLVLFAGQLFGRENILTESVGEIVDFVEGFQKDLPVILRTVTWIFLIVVISRFLRWLVRLVMTKLKKGKSVISLADSIIKYIFAGFLIFKVLGLWGVDTTTLLASAGILGLVVGLGAQSLIADIISGLFIIFERPFQVGDIILMDGFRGTVQEIGIRNTKILDGGGDLKIISNSDIRTVVNMTRALSVAMCVVTVMYSESIEEIEKIFTKNLATIRKNIPAIMEGPFYMGVDQLGQNGCTIRIMAQCKEEDRFQTARDLNREVKLLLDKHGIKISLPQIVVNRPSDKSEKDPK